MIKKVAYILSGLIITSTLVLSQVGSISNNNWFYTAPTVNTQLSAQAIPADISREVAVIINGLVNKYSLTESMQSALIQSTRAYMSIINNIPRNQQEAIILNNKEVAANNCLSSRLNNNILDDVTFKLEQAALDTTSKRSAYEYYLSFIGEGIITNTVTSACDDSYGNPSVVDNNQVQNVNIPNSNSGSNNNYNNSLKGIVSDDNINTRCTVLTSFLSFGSKGTQVYNLQYFLVDNGYMEHQPTSYYGRNTEAAVLEWQKRHGVDQRGYIGPNTRASIASLSCNGDQSKINAAYNGTYNVTYSSNTSNVKVVKAVTANTPNKATVATTTVATDTTTYIASNYNAPTTTNFTSNSLVTTSGIFYTKRSPVNTLYFSYKASTGRDPIFYCLEKTGANTCGNYESFSQVSERYEPGNIDIINNADRWLFNIYYNTNWVNGGKIYLRNGINNISEVYTVQVRDSL